MNLLNLLEEKGQLLISNMEKKSSHDLKVLLRKWTSINLVFLTKGPQRKPFPLTNCSLKGVRSYKISEEMVVKN